MANAGCIRGQSQELHREISEQRTAHEKRVEALTEAVATAGTSLAEQHSQLEAWQRENTNLTTLNDGLSGRIEKAQSVLASTEAQLLALTAQHTAEQREWEAIQSMMTARLADKDAWIVILQRQITELPNDPEATDRLGGGRLYSVVEKLPGTTTRVIHSLSG